MPEYSFLCEECDHGFTIFCSYSGYDDRVNRLTCEKCHSVNVHRDYITDCSNISGSVKKSDSELKTIGHLADRNRDRMSDDQKESLARKHNDYKLNKPDDPLPQGMSRIKKPQKTSWKIKKK